MKNRKVVTIQQTGKLWKLLQLLGNATIILLVTFMFLRWGEMRNLTIGLSMLGVFLAGVMLHVIGRVGAWWFHG